MKCLGKARPNQAARRLAGIGFDSSDAATNHLAFVCLYIKRALNKAMAKHLPSCCQARVDNLRIRMANRGVQTHGGPNTMVVQHALQAPEANPEAVVEPA